MRPIDADALKAKFENQDSGALGGHKRYFVCCVIDDEPTIEAVPVVRCKDCKYRRDDDFCGGRGWPAQLVPDDGYCDRGARMDGDSE